MTAGGLHHVRLAMPLDGESEAAAFYEGRLGIPKVDTIGTPVTAQVAVVTGDLLDRTRIEEAVRRAGLEPLTLADRAAVERALAESVPGVALVDLRVGEAERIVGLLAAAEVEVTVFGPHVDEAALERARAAGAVEALPRSRFFSRLPRMFEARGGTNPP